MYREERAPGEVEVRELDAHIQKCEHRFQALILHNSKKIIKNKPKILTRND